MSRMTPAGIAPRGAELADFDRPGMERTKRDIPPMVRFSGWYQLKAPQDCKIWSAVHAKDFFACFHVAAKSQHAAHMPWPGIASNHCKFSGYIYWYHICIINKLFISIYHYITGVRLAILRTKQLAKIRISNLRYCHILPTPMRSIYFLNLRRRFFGVASTTSSLGSTAGAVSVLPRPRVRFFGAASFGLAFAFGCFTALATQDIIP